MHPWQAQEGRNQQRNIIFNLLVFIDQCAIQFSAQCTHIAHQFMYNVHMVQSTFPFFQRWRKTNKKKKKKTNENCTVPFDITFTNNNTNKRYK